MGQTRTSKPSVSEPAVDELPFEEAFARMQNVIGQLERGDLSLDAAMSAFEQGMQLAKRCNYLLDTAQLRVQSLETVDGSFGLLNIEVDTE